MQITQLSEATQRPRRIAVGEFDGVHVGHRAVIAGQRHGADLRAAPDGRATTRGGPEAAHKP